MLSAILDVDPTFRPTAGPSPWEPETIPRGDA